MRDYLTEVLFHDQCAWSWLSVWEGIMRRFDSPDIMPRDRQQMLIVKLFKL